jgi:uroporphyrinogen-III decarboxylase
MRKMTPRQRIRAALRGAPHDQVPFTIYWIMLPRGEREARLRRAGLAIVERLALYWEEHPNCELLQRTYYERGIKTVRDIIRTPVGEATAVRKLGLSYGSEVYTEHFIKHPQDYRVMAYYAQDAVYHADYDAYHIAVDRLGEDGYVLPHIGYSPYMLLQQYWLGVERFSLELAEHPDELFSLYELLCRRYRELYALYARSPAEAVLYCGNVVGNVVGPARFQRYIVPCLTECADMLHEAGKLLGTHLDASIKNLAPAVAAAPIDIVEAFTPAPDCDMSVADARQIWPDKVLWCNFPSSMHLFDAAAIEETTREMLRQSAPGDKLLIGVTEDIPEAVMWRSLGVIARTINAEGRLPIAPCAPMTVTSSP